MQKIEIIGDSILRGVIYSDKFERYKLCSDNRYTSLTKYGFSVRNDCRMGARARDGAEILARHLNLIDETTGVLFEFGGNDCDFNWDAISANPNGVHHPNTPPDEFLETYRSLIATARSRGAEVFVASLVPMNTVRYMAWLSRGRDRDAILAWLGEESMLYRWQEYYSGICVSMAHSEGCPIVDLRSPFLLSHRLGDLTSTDGIHPSQAGHDLINSTLRGFFAKYAER